MGKVLSFNPFLFQFSAFLYRSLLRSKNQTTQQGLRKRWQYRTMLITYMYGTWYTSICGHRYLNGKIFIHSYVLNAITCRPRIEKKTRDDVDVEDVDKVVGVGERKSKRARMRESDGRCSLSAAIRRHQCWQANGASCIVVR